MLRMLMRKSFEKCVTIFWSGKKSINNAFISNKVYKNNKRITAIWKRELKTKKKIERHQEKLLDLKKTVSILDISNNRCKRFGSFHTLSGNSLLYHYQKLYLWIRNLIFTLLFESQILCVRHFLLKYLIHD